MNTRETISAPEAAKLCGVSRSTIGNWIQAKRLFARRSGRVYTIQKIDLLLFIEAMGKSIPEELENEKFTQPLFRSFQHCWEFYGGHHHGGSYNACVASKRRLAVCFIARNNRRFQCPESCHACRYYQKTFFPRSRLILQLGIPAAVCQGLYFGERTTDLQKPAGIPPEAFVGMDIEAVIHPESLGTVISLLKKREIGEDLPRPAPVSVKTETDRRKAGVEPLDFPPGRTRRCIAFSGIRRGDEWTNGRGVEWGI
jgi:excisionase family DNA binding protein